MFNKISTYLSIALCNLYRYNQSNLLSSFKLPLERLGNLKNYLPVINFCISFTALGFQTCILYPWHNNLDKKFDKLFIKFDKLNK